MPKTVRDSQRTKVFYAQYSVPNQPTIDKASIHTWYRNTVKGAFWTRRVQATQLPFYEKDWWLQKQIDFSDEGHVVCTPHQGTIYVPKANAPVAILGLVHQLAHVITDAPDEAKHGRTFCKTFLELTRKFMGDDMWKALKAAFREKRVKWVVISEEGREAKKQAWYDRQAATAPDALAKMIAELEAEE